MNEKEAKKIIEEYQRDPMAYSGTDFEWKMQEARAYLTDVEHKAEIAELKARWERTVENEIRLELDLTKERERSKALVEALEATLTALVSYKKYIPEPYKQNPIYIIGAHEAEKKAIEALNTLRKNDETNLFEQGKEGK